MTEYVLGMFPPDWGVLPSLWIPLLETLWMGTVAILLSSAIAMPLSFLAARNTSPNLFVYMASRAALDFVRAIPTLLWALLFVVMTGLGPTAGILALTCHCVGTLGKYFSEAVEAFGPKTVDVLEAMRLDGATERQAIRHGLVPAVAPLFAGYILYYFEWSVRVGTILGMVGAGGLGVKVFASIQLFRRRETAAIICVILVLVMAVNCLSRFVRERLV